MSGDYSAMLEGLFSQTVPSPEVITPDKIEARLAEVRDFERDYLPFMVDPLMQAYAAILMSPVDPLDIAGRRAARLAKTDLASGRRAMAEDPLNWRQ
jgi:hypothetical protein